MSLLRALGAAVGAFTSELWPPRVLPRVDAAADLLARKEAEEEVSEPRPAWLQEAIDIHTQMAADGLGADVDDVRKLVEDGWPPLDGLIARMEPASANLIDTPRPCCCDDERTLQPCGRCRLDDHELCARFDAPSCPDCPRPEHGGGCERPYEDAEAVARLNRNPETKRRLEEARLSVDDAVELQSPVACAECGTKLAFGERIFAGKTVTGPFCSWMCALSAEQDSVVTPPTTEPAPADSPLSAGATPAGLHVLLDDAADFLDAEMAEHALTDAEMDAAQAFVNGMRARAANARITQRLRESETVKRFPSSALGKYPD